MMHLQKYSSLGKLKGLNYIKSIFSRLSKLMHEIRSNYDALTWTILPRREVDNRPRQADPR